MPSILVFIAVVIPWLNPFSMGPTPAVIPWLVTLGALALLLVAAARVRLAEVSAAAWLVAALLSSLLGLLQYFGVSAVLGPWVNSTNVGEAFANLRQRNQFATLTNIGLAALLWWVVVPGRTALVAQKEVWLMSVPFIGRLLVPLAAVLLAVGNASSSSRTGLLQLLVLCVMAWAWGRLVGGRRASAMNSLLVLALVAYMLAALALPWLAGLDPSTSGILARLHEGDLRCASRLTLWRNVLHLIAEKPWLGWGWGNLDYAHFITLYPDERFCDILDNAHNLPLHLAVELGVPLALVLCASGLWLTWRAKPWRERDATRQLAWAVLVLILLHSLLEYPLWYGPFQMAFGLSVWLLVRAPVTDEAMPESKGFWPLAPVSKALAALFLLAFAGYAGWDYHRISQIYQAPTLRSPAYRDNTLAKISNSWLFQNQVQFAELTTTRLTPANALHLQQLSQHVLHFSPEPRVVEKLIESAVMLGRDDEALFYLARYRAAFADSYARWSAKNKR